MELKVKDFIIDKNIPLALIENPVKATACAVKGMKLYEESKILKSLFNIGRIKLRVLKPILEGLLLIETVKNLSVVLPSPTKITEVNANASINLPECLVGKKVTAVANKINNSTSKASVSVEIKNNIDIMSVTAEDYINKTVSGIVNSVYLPFFYLLDEYRWFIQKTEFAKLYKEWKEDYSCFVNNCEPLKDIVTDDSYMWEDNRSQFILPIDINSGKLRLWKILGNPSETTKDKCYEIEKEYYDFTQKRKELAQQGKKILYEKGIPDEINPFIELINKYKI